MDKKELQALISQGEGLHIEFKESINTGLAKEMVAFANTKGGVILIGVDDSGGIKNKSFDNGDRSKIQTAARECDPSLDIEIETVSDEPHVLVARVPVGLNKPYRCTSGFYMREGASSVKRTTAEIKEMFQDANWFSFDDQLCLKADFQTEFSRFTLRNFMAKFGKEQILSDEDTLHNLGVLEFVDNKPVLNNTGILFFTTHPQKFLPQSTIQCVRYKGTTKVSIEDQKDLTFDIQSCIDEVFTFLRMSLKVGFEFEEGNPERKEVWEIPYIALREAVINAIAHRDYLNRGSHIQIEVFDDRVSITNYGGLVKGLSESDLGKRSLHRNPNIVNLLHRANYIEKLGTGIARINDELKKANLPKAEFDISEHWFTIVFSRTKGAQMGEAEMGETEMGELELPKLNFVLTARDYLILEACQIPKSRGEVLTDILKIANRRTNYEKNMEHLVHAGLLNMTNPDIPTHPHQKYYTSEIGLIFLNDLYTKLT